MMVVLPDTHLQQLPSWPAGLLAAASQGSLSSSSSFPHPPHAYALGVPNLIPLILIPLPCQIPLRIFKLISMTGSVGQGRCSRRRCPLTRPTPPLTGWRFLRAKQHYCYVMIVIRNCHYCHYNLSNSSFDSGTSSGGGWTQVDVAKMAMRDRGWWW